MTKISLLGLVCFALLSISFFGVTRFTKNNTPISGAASTERKTGEIMGESLESNGHKTVASHLQELETQIERLRRELRLEQESTLALQAELQALKSELQLAASIDPASQQADPTIEDTPGLDQSVVAQSPEIQAASNEAAMISAGVDLDTARELASRMDRYTLAQLDLRDRAAREGWLDTDEYQQRRETELPERVDIRAELGVDVWDQYLYASGRNNRVRVASVLAGSAAADAGVEVGDLVVEYAEYPIFSVQELQRATRDGERGEPVAVRLLRQDVFIDATVPRGPLGVTLAAQRRSAVKGRSGP